MLVDRYLITVQVIPDKVDEVVLAIKQVVKMDYGKYKSVYFKSSEGEDFHINPDEGMEVAEVNASVQIDFSIEKDDELLGELVVVIGEAHPWREPVIRVAEVRETRLEE